MRPKMKKLMHNQAGFIPMLLTILGLVVAVIVLAYLRVSHASR
jgi:hypothetical protein